MSKKHTRDGIECLARELSEGTRRHTADGRPTMTPEQARARIVRAVTISDHKSDK